MSGLEHARLVARTAKSGRPLPRGAPCCAWCAGVVADPAMPTEPPSEVLRKKRGNPLAICAYQVRAADEAGKDVAIVPSDTGEPPMLRVAGKVVDPLEHYAAERCGC